MAFAVQRVSGSDWQKYRDIRLESLKNDPSAFGSSYNEEIKRSDQDWQTRLELAENPEGDRFFYVVADSDNFIANGGAFKDQNNEWNIIAIYVKKDYRGLGVGSQLIAAILNELTNRKIKEVHLRVNVSQEAAVALYEKFDFKIAKTVEKELMGDGKYYDEYEMIKRFNL